jgi:hypothetical protein
MSNFLKLDAPELDRWFVEGRSPACWRQQLSHSVARQETVAQTCAWVEEMVVDQSPSSILESGPLFGGCLAELVDVPAQIEQKATESQPRKAAKPAFKSTPSKGTTRQKRSFTLPKRAGSIKLPPLRKSADSSGDLLRRWAGKTAAVQNSGLNRRRPKRPVQNGTRVTPPAAGYTSQEWANQLVGRTRERLTQDEKLSASTGTSSKSLTKRFDKGQISLSDNDKIPANIEDQLRQSLLGKTVSVEVLESLVPDLAESQTNSKEKRANPNRSGNPERSSISTDSASRNRNFPFNPVSTQRRKVESVAWSEDGRKRPPINTSPPQTAALREDRLTSTFENGLSDQHQGNIWADSTRQGPRFAPPQVAETMPPLQALPHASPLRPLPIASETAEWSARREGTQATLSASGVKTAPAENLDDLARQIKQIIDEESRRHGIDV